MKKEEESSISDLLLNSDSISSEKMQPQPRYRKPTSAPSFHRFQYQPVRQKAAQNNLILNLCLQGFSMFLVILTMFVGAWDCNSVDRDHYCDWLLIYHLGQGQSEQIKFGVNSLSACEQAALDQSKCWNIGVAVAYICLATGGLFYGAFGFAATLQRLCSWKCELLAFPLAVRIAHWIYLTAIISWLVFTGAILHFFSLGWCPYLLLVNPIALGTITALHHRYWYDRLERQRLVNALLAPVSPPAG